MDPISMSFSLNQAVLNTAIAAALPSLLKELEFDYVSGRAPKGLQATVTITEPMIRKAVENYARRTVNATFTHFGIEFQATRGEDGIVANITASNAPIQPEETKAPAPASAKPAAEAPKAVAPAPEPEVTEAVEPEAEVQTEPAEVEEVVAEALPTLRSTPTNSRPLKSKLRLRLKSPRRPRTKLKLPPLRPRLPLLVRSSSLISSVRATNLRSKPA